MLGLGQSLVSGGALSKEYLLDQVTGAKLAYSLRKVKGSYTGPAIRVRRDDDNAEKDIYFRADDTIDIQSLEDFVTENSSTANGFVSRWYNQAAGDPTTLLDKDYGQGASFALSTRRVDVNYNGPCMAVRGTSELAGLRLVSPQGDSNVSVKTQGERIQPATSTNMSFEVWSDCPSRNGQQTKFVVRAGSGTLLGNNWRYVYQRQWTRFETTSPETLDANRIAIILDDQGLQPGDQFFIRNVQFTGAGIAAVDMSDFSTGDIEVKPANSYNVGFDNTGSVHTENIVKFSKESNPSDPGNFLPAKVSVHRWFDQSGSGKFMDQNTYSRMPEIFRDANSDGNFSIAELNDKPCIHFGNGQGFDDTDLVGNTSTGVSHFHAGRRVEPTGPEGERPASEQGRRTIMGLIPTQDSGLTNVFEVFEVNDWSEDIYVFRNDTGGVVQPGDTNNYFSNGFNRDAVDQDKQYVFHFIQDEDLNAIGGLNANSATAAHTATEAVAYDHITMLRINNSGGESTGQDDGVVEIQEMLLFPSDKSSDRQAIVDNINSYFRIYNSEDLVQETLNLQGKIAHLGSTYADSSNLPYVDTRSADYTSPVAIAQPFTAFATVRLENIYDRVLFGGINWSPAEVTETGRKYMRLGNLYGDLSVDFTSKQLFTGLANGAASIINYNGDLDKTGNAGSATITLGSNIFTQTGASMGTPRAYELIVYDSGVYTDLGTVESEINDHYGIF